MILVSRSSWFLLLAGLALAAFGIYFIALGNEARGWLETEGTILSVTVRTESQPTGNLRHWPSRRTPRRDTWITYRSVDGASSTGSRYRLGNDP
ncbi:MAG: hypothetical protein R2862_01080 [Thermoanaerobaculia bacterium]